MENERKHSRPPRTGAATDAVRIAVPPSREPRRAAHPRLAATAPRQPHGLDRRSALGGALTVPARPRSHPRPMPRAWYWWSWHLRSDFSILCGDHGDAAADEWKMSGSILDPRAPEPQQTRSESLSPLHGSPAVPRTLDWKQLLPDSRTGSTGEAPSAARSPFQRDHDRILFSGPFRRLADKTQVFPLPVDDHVHSRLTHSLEVATIGRSLGTLVGRRLVESGVALPEGRDARDAGG